MLSCDDALLSISVVVNSAESDFSGVGGVLSIVVVVSVESCFPGSFFNKTKRIQDKRQHNVIYLFSSKAANAGRTC